MLNTSLYQGELVKLTAIRPDSDAEIESRWMHDPDYFLSARRGQPFRPPSAGQLKKDYEEAEKEDGRQGNRFRFAVRRREDDELVGFIRLRASSWSNRAGVLEYSFAGPAEETRFGPDLLRLALRFAFDELNLHRLSSNVPEFHSERIDQLRAAGFQCEVCRRNTVYRGGRLWDSLLFGILESEWVRETRPGGEA